LRVLYDYGIDAEERRAVLAVLQGDKFSRNEQRTKLEKEFCDYVGTKYAIAVGSGTAALHCALMAVGVGRDDEVIIVPNTHSTPVMCIMNTGARPVFVDIDDEILNIDSSKIEEKITPKTKALLPVHSSGHPYDVDAVKEMAERHGLPVIEDAAQSLGAKYKGKRIGAFGNVGIFSFAEHKHVHGGGRGGVAVTNDEDIADVVRTYAHQGRDKRYYEKNEQGVHTHISAKVGYSYRLSEVNAAIARVQFKKFREGPHSVEKRRGIAKRYNEMLKDISPIRTPVEKDWAYHSYCRYVVRAKDRDRLYSYLDKRNIYLAIHYYTPIYREPYFLERYGPSNEIYPVTEQAAREVLTLPSWPTLTQTQQEYVVSKIKKFYAG